MNSTKNIFCQLKDVSKAFFLKVEVILFFTTVDFDLNIIQERTFLFSTGNSTVTLSWLIKDIFSTRYYFRRKPNGWTRNYMTIQNQKDVFLFKKTDQNFEILSWCQIQENRSIILKISFVFTFFCVVGVLRKLSWIVLHCVHTVNLFSCKKWWYKISTNRQKFSSRTFKT